MDVLIDMLLTISRMNQNDSSVKSHMKVEIKKFMNNNDIDLSKIKNSD